MRTEAASLSRGAAGGASDAGAAGSGAGGSGSLGSGGVGSLAGCRRGPDLTPSFPSPVMLDAELVARAAAVVGSCLADDGVDRNAAHIWLEHLGAPKFYFRQGEQLDCLANARCGCSAVQQCLGWVYQPLMTPCTNSCVGDVLTACSDGVQVTLDCSRYGLSCDPGAYCIDGAALACDSAQPATCTAEGAVRYCDDGFFRETPCGSLGFSCRAGRCVGDGASCLRLGCGLRTSRQRLELAHAARLRRRHTIFLQRRALRAHRLHDTRLQRLRGD